MYSKALLIRLERTTAELIGEVARARGESASSFARRAIITELAKLGFLDERDRKALGIQASADPEVT
jgi:hypothetical protein